MWGKIHFRSLFHSQSRPFVASFLSEPMHWGGGEGQHVDQGDRGARDSDLGPSSASPSSSPARCEHLEPRQKHDELQPVLDTVLTAPFLPCQR